MAIKLAESVRSDHTGRLPVRGDEGAGREANDDIVLRLLGLLVEGEGQGERVRGRASRLEKGVPTLGLYPDGVRVVCAQPIQWK